MEEFTAIFKARDVLREKLGDKQLEFKLSDISPVLSIVDLNCESEHESLDKIYTIGAYKGSYHLYFESTLFYESLFTSEKATELIDSGFRFEIYHHTLKITKHNMTLEDLAKNVEFLVNFLFNF